VALLAMGLWQASLPQAGAAGAPYVIGAVFDMTGPASPLGTPEANTVKMLAKQLNARGGINGHPIELKIIDNGSEEARSVTAMQRLIEGDKVLAIIGPSQTGTTLAGAQLVSDKQVPMVSCAAGIKIVDPVKPWIFKTAQSDVCAVQKVIDYVKVKKLTKIAVISVSNAFGDSGRQQLEAQTPGAKIQIVAKEKFGAPEDAIVQTGDFVGYMLDKAVEKGVKEIIFIGHSGKLVKVAARIFNTHHKVGDARNEVIAAYAGAAGASRPVARGDGENPVPWQARGARRTDNRAGGGVAGNPGRPLSASLVAVQPFWSA
jgi:ABC-type branched-subunit amino acid transport system substrate-binding protein